MNTTGGFDRGNGVHNTSLAKCAEGLNTCFLKAAPPQPQHSTVMEGRPPRLLVSLAAAPKIPDCAAAADTSHEQHQAESLLMTCWCEEVPSRTASWVRELGRGGNFRGKKRSLLALLLMVV